MDRPAAACLVALYASIFLYHRHYDLVLLTLPLVYVVGKVREGQGVRRWLYAGIAVCILLAVLVFLTSTHVLKPGGGEALSFAQSGAFRTLAFLAGCGAAVSRGALPRASSLKRS